MTASSRTVKSVVDVILNYMEPEKAIAMLDELQTVPGNQSFKETLILIRRGISVERVVSEKWIGQSLSPEQEKAWRIGQAQTRLFASLRAGLCGCHKCISDRGEVATIMVLCPTCGNKRCPKASDHRFVCTNSNEPGQTGSVYA